MRRVTDVKRYYDRPDPNSGVCRITLAMGNHQADRDPIVRCHCLLRCVLHRWEYRRELNDARSASSDQVVRVCMLVSSFDKRPSFSLCITDAPNAVFTALFDTAFQT